MIITKTPFRISFFGGGTDIEEWFLKEGGQVLSVSINKFSYVTARKLPEFFDHKIRLAYSKMESVKNLNEIQHPLIRVILQKFEIKNIEIHHDSDLPSRSGIGSSSSFGVGLVNALSGLEGKLLTKKDAADLVINFERKVLNENGGFQDQIAASYGGLNHIVFYKDGHYNVKKIKLSTSRLKDLSEMINIFYIPLKRYSHDVSIAKNLNEKGVYKKLKYIQQSVDEALEILINGDLLDFGKLVGKNWLYKRSFNQVSNGIIDEIYNKGISAGALGGKLLGAGGGGFFMFLCEKKKQHNLIKALENIMYTPVELEFEGSKIIYKA